LPVENHKSCVNLSVGIGFADFYQRLAGICDLEALVRGMNAPPTNAMLFRTEDGLLAWENRVGSDKKAKNKGETQKGFSCHGTIPPG